MPSKLIIQENEIFGNWKVLEPNIINPETTAKNYIGKPIFSKCICLNCNETIRFIRNNELKKHSNKLCKKCAKQKSVSSTWPKIDDHFGKLTIIGDGGIENYRHYSLCKCECGNIVKVQDNKLKTGNNSSCGKCKYSKGEYAIKQILDNNNIIYEHDSMLPELFNQTKRRLRFDFIIYTTNGEIDRFIEFDGNQHKTGMWGGNWSNTETYETIHERDLIKNKFCLNNGYTLIRIPYEKLNNLTLEDLLGNKFKIGDDKNE